MVNESSDMFPVVWQAGVDIASHWKLGKLGKLCSVSNCVVRCELHVTHWRSSQWATVTRGTVCTCHKWSMGLSQETL